MVSEQPQLQGLGCGHSKGLSAAWLARVRCLAVCPSAFTALPKRRKTSSSGQVLLQPGSESMSVWDADETVLSNQEDGVKWDTLATSKLSSL